MPKHGDNIYHRKDGRWEGRFVKGRENGKTQYGYVFAKTKQEARERLAQRRGEWQAGCDAAERRKTNLSAVAEDWLSECKALRKESTIAQYRERLKRYILPKFGNIPVGAISTLDMVEFKSQLFTRGGIDGGNLSPRTVNATLCILKMLGDFARRRGYPVCFSTDGLCVKQGGKPLRVFSAEEQERLRHYLEENLTLCNLGILFCLMTGIRIGELCALRWEDISLWKGEVHIRQTRQRIGTDEGIARTRVANTLPKSDTSVRTIPLTKWMCEKLIPFFRKEAYLLTGKDDSPMEPRVMQYRFKGVLTACEIRDANFHALRHTFATNCVEAGVDAKCLSEMLGHSDVYFTFNRYVHPTFEMKRKGLEKAFAAMVHPSTRGKIDLNSRRSS